MTNPIADGLPDFDHPGWDALVEDVEVAEPHGTSPEDLAPIVEDPAQGLTRLATQTAGLFPGIFLEGESYGVTAIVDTVLALLLTLSAARTSEHHMASFEADGRWSLVHPESCQREECRIHLSLSSVGEQGADFEHPGVGIFHVAVVKDALSFVSVEDAEPGTPLFADPN